MSVLDRNQLTVNGSLEKRDKKEEKLNETFYVEYHLQKTKQVTIHMFKYLIRGEEKGEISLLPNEGLAIALRPQQQAVQVHHLILYRYR